MDSNRAHSQGSAPTTGLRRAAESAPVHDGIAATRPGRQRASSRSPANRRLALSTVFLALGMLGTSYAAVPLYQLFCQVTGFGGTTQRAVAPPSPAQTPSRKITIRFDTQVSKSLPLTFRPLLSRIETHLDTVEVVEFEIVNRGQSPLSTLALFNVTPLAAGIHFNKVECFCFEEQTLMPGERNVIPVTFFVDREYANTPELATAGSVTLSYTLVHGDEGAPSEATHG